MEAVVPSGVGCARRTAAGRSGADCAVPPAPLRRVLVAALATTGCRAVYAVTFGLDGEALAAADGSGCTYLWDTAGGLAATFAHPGSRGVLGVAFDPGGDLLAAADGNGRAYLWDLVTGELARTFAPRRSGGLNDVAFGLGGDLLAAAGGSGCTFLWKMSPRAS